jgi:hypothetical protein
MAGIRTEGSDCTNYLDYVAQAPDGLFLACVPKDNGQRWLRGDA